MPYCETSVEARFLHGDLEAVGIVIRWIATVISAPRFGALRPDWLDLHQEIMGRVIESLRRERYDDSQDFQAYVQAVARYTGLQALGTRRRKGGLQAFDGERAAGGPSAEAAIVTSQLTRQVLDQASDGCRGLLKAYFLEQRTYSEIAGSLGVPVGTVKSRLVRCLETANRAIRGMRSSRHTRAE
jgi:RNA polymerase sigma factor (sigma-70 family)